MLTMDYIFYLCLPTSTYCGERQLFASKVYPSFQALDPPLHWAAMIRPHL